MPRAAANKRRKVEEDESSSSDSGPEDRNPPQTSVKKSESAGDKKPVANTSAGGDLEQSWNLDKTKMLKVRHWKGKTYIDIREYYEKDGKVLPGKKGISLTPPLWNKIKSLIPEVDKALEEI